MIKYTYQFDETSPKIEMTLSAETTWNEALEAFYEFLLGAGYKLSGHFELVPDDKEAING